MTISKMQPEDVHVHELAGCVLNLHDRLVDQLELFGLVDGMELGPEANDTVRRTGEVLASLREYLERYVASGTPGISASQREELLQEVRFAAARKARGVDLDDPEQERANGWPPAAAAAAPQGQDRIQELEHEVEGLRRTLRLLGAAVSRAADL